MVDMSHARSVSHQVLPVGRLDQIQQYMLLYC